jgi:hypothetical protein
MIIYARTWLVRLNAEGASGACTPFHHGTEAGRRIVVRGVIAEPSIPHQVQGDHLPGPNVIAPDAGDELRLARALLPLPGLVLGAAMDPRDAALVGPDPTIVSSRAD